MKPKKPTLKSKIIAAKFRTIQAVKDFRFALKIFKFAYQHKFLSIVATYDKTGVPAAVTMMTYFMWDVTSVSMSTDFDMKNKTVTTVWRMQ